MPELFWTAALLLNVGVFAAADSPKDCPPAPSAAGEAHVSDCSKSEFLCGTKCEVSRHFPSGRFELKLHCQLPSEIVPVIKTVKPMQSVRVPKFGQLHQALSRFATSVWGGQTKPSAHYLREDVAYFPAGPEFQLHPKKPVPAPEGFRQVGFEPAPHPQPIKPVPPACRLIDDVQFFPPAPHFPAPPVMPVAEVPPPVACPVGVFPVPDVPVYGPHPAPVAFGPHPQMPLGPPAYGPPHPVMRPMPVPPGQVARTPYVKTCVCKGPNGQERVVYEACLAESSCCKDGCECKECKCPGCDKKKTASVPVYAAPFATPSENHVLCFGAEWCGPCQQMKPIIHDLISHGCPLKVVNIDQHPEFAKRFNVNVLPSFVAVVDGEACDRAVGILSPQQIRALAQRVQRGKPAPEALANHSYPGAISVTKIVEVQYGLTPDKGEMLAKLLREQCSIDVKQDGDILTITTTDEKQKAVANFIATVVGPSPQKMASKAERNIAKSAVECTPKLRPVTKIRPTTVRFPTSSDPGKYLLRKVKGVPVKYQAPVAYPKAKSPACAESASACTLKADSIVLTCRSSTSEGSLLRLECGPQGVCVRRADSEEHPSLSEAKSPVCGDSADACSLTADSLVLTCRSLTSEGSLLRLECGPQGVCVRRTDSEEHPLLSECQDLGSSALDQLPKVVDCEFRRCLDLEVDAKGLLPSVISEEVRQVLDKMPMDDAIEKRQWFPFSIGINR